MFDGTELVDYRPGSGILFPYIAQPDHSGQSPFDHIRGSVESQLPSLILSIRVLGHRGIPNLEADP